MAKRKPRPRLIQLPDGTWVDRDTIVLVEAQTAHRIVDGPEIPPRVVVHLECGARFVAGMASHEKAVAERDRIARQVNGKSCG
jgi:hypothetical protein